MSALQGYFLEAETGRIVSRQGTRNRNWCRVHRNGTQEWRDELHRRRVHKKLHGTLAEVKRMRAGQMLSRARYTAKKDHGVISNLRLEDIEIPDRCPITGRPFRFREGRAHDDSPSLDRVNPRRSYVRGNVRVISWWANRKKTNLENKMIGRLHAYQFSHEHPEVFRRLIRRT